MTTQRVLHLCLRLPAQVRGGRDLRLREQLAVMAAVGPTGVFALTGTGAVIDERLQLWQAGTDETVARPMAAQELAPVIAAGSSPFAVRFSSRTADELRETIGQFSPDVVIICGLELATYITVVREAGVERIVFDLDESSLRTYPSIAAIESNRGRAVFIRHVATAAQRAEAEAVAQVDEVWLDSEIECAHFRAAYPNAALPRLVPNTLDVESIEYVPGDDPRRARQTLIYPASFGYEPNLDAARFLVNDLLPLLPDAHLQFVGSGLPDWMRTLDDPHVSTTGPVRDMAPYLVRAAAMPVPLRAGGGTRLKALEALAAGLPIVSTTFGVEGLGMADTGNYLHAETAAEFADALTRLRNDAALARSLSNAGREHVAQRFSRRALIDALRPTAVG